MNPFALGAAFVERAVELGWVEVDSDGRRSSYFLTDSGNEGLEKFGVKIEKALQFAILPERNDSAPKRRASSSMQAHRQAHGSLQHGGSHARPGKGPGLRVHHERREGGERHEHREHGERREHHIHHERHGGQRKRGER